jgi:hypothetical protein
MTEMAVSKSRRRGRGARDSHAGSACAAHARSRIGGCSGSFPNERIHAHDWRGGCVHVGEIPRKLCQRVDRRRRRLADPDLAQPMLMEEPWDLIINVGHVVPHEVLGFANHNKNYFIGLGGKDLICASHMMAACCGIENNLGTLVTPVRRLFQQGRGRLPRHLPDLYVQVVMRATTRRAGPHRRVRGRRSGDVSRCRPAVAGAEHHRASTSRSRRSSA